MCVASLCSRKKQPRSNSLTPLGQLSVLSVTWWSYSIDLSRRQSVVAKRGLQVMPAYLKEGLWITICVPTSSLSLAGSPLMSAQARIRIIFHLPDRSSTSAVRTMVAVSTRAGSGVSFMHSLLERCWSGNFVEREMPERAPGQPAYSWRERAEAHEGLLLSAASLPRTARLPSRRWRACRRAAACRCNGARRCERALVSVMCRRCNGNLPEELGRDQRFPPMLPVRRGCRRTKILSLRR